MEFSVEEAESQGIPPSRCRESTRRSRRDVVEGSSRGPFNRDLHCPRAQSSQKCRRGSGMRYYNSNQYEWNLADQFTAGRADNWECYPCCRLPGYSIELCPASSGSQSSRGNGNGQYGNGNGGNGQYGNGNGQYGNGNG